VNNNYERRAVLVYAHSMHAQSILLSRHRWKRDGMSRWSLTGEFCRACNYPTRFTRVHALENYRSRITRFG